MHYETERNDRPIEDAEFGSIIHRALENASLNGKRVLFIVPDGTRSFPAHRALNAVHTALAGKAKQIDFLIALGTHPPMTDDAIARLYGVSECALKNEYRPIRFINHDWQNNAQMKPLGVITKERIAEITEGIIREDAPIAINRLVFEYDRIFIAGPVVPHEVVGFSGGYKYLFPGISAPEFLNLFHWLGAALTIPRVIGVKDTPVRALINEARRLLPVAISAFCFVMRGGDCYGLYYDDETQRAWERAVAFSETTHITRIARPVKRALTLCPPRYADLWTGAKCVYPLEQIVEDGGEIVVYAPHIKEFSYTHNAIIETIGYHTRDFFMQQWEAYRQYPLVVLAHATHVKGLGTYENGVETPRIRVTIASAISEERITRAGLHYAHPNDIRVEEWEEAGDLIVRKGGETLYQLNGS